MAEAKWSIRPPGEKTLERAPQSARGEAQERFARQVQERLADGYRIESQSATKVVLVEPPRKWLGITLRGEPARVTVLLDQ
jgi:hypothetical protein